MKKILLIGLLLGHPLMAYAEGQDAAGNDPAASMADTTQRQDVGLNVVDPDLPSTVFWEGFRLENELIRPESAQPELRRPELLKPSAPAPKLHSAIALIYDQQTQRPLYTKNANARASIASITKLMTAMVVLDALQPLSEAISVEASDIDKLKRTPSRLNVGMTFTRNEMLSLALMSSENRAASALARSYPGGTAAAVAAMNAKARELGMQNTYFLDPAGLSGGNVSTAQDLVKMVSAANNYALIHQYTTASSNSVEGLGGRVLRFINTNPLVRNVGWNIGLSKTGFINEAGRCLVMEANINQRSVIIVLLNSWGKRTRIGDANRIKKWMESADTRSRPPRRG